MAGGLNQDVFRRYSFAAICVALALSACSGSAGGQAATQGPTSSPTVQPSAGPTSSPSTTPSQATGSAAALRLCDTKVQSANPALRNVRFGRHDTYDRLAFDFCKPADTTLNATVVKQLTEDGSGAKVTLKGKYFIRITLTPADAHSSTGRPTVPSHAVTVAGRNMQQYKLIGDFEGVVTYGLGVMRLEETALAIQTDPNDSRHIILYFDLGPQRG